MRRLYQREGRNNNSPHHLYQPVHSSKSLWPLLIFTLLLLLHLQPLPPFPTQKAPAIPTLMDIIPKQLVLSIPDLESQLIRPSPFHTVVHQNGPRVEQVWIFQMVLQPEVDPHQPTPIENLNIYNISITMIRLRILVLNLIPIQIRLLVAV